MGSTKMTLRTAALTILLVGLALAAEHRQELKYTVPATGSVSVVNDLGPVTVHGVSGRQVTIVATTHSDKLEVDANQYGNRLDVRTHVLEKVSGSEARVEYDVSVPQDVAVTVHAAGGPITVEKMREDVVLEGDAAQVDVHDVANCHVHVRTLAGPITLRNITNGHIELSSVSGDVHLDNVSGRKVSVNATKGNITYDGAFGEDGTYTLINNSGNIDVTIPTSASVDLTAHSVTGSVENDFPLQQKTHAFMPSSARTLVGTSNTAGSSVDLRSFSGRIRVKKH